MKTFFMIILCFLIQIFAQKKEEQKKNSKGDDDFEDYF